MVYENKMNLTSKVLILVFFVFICLCLLFYWGWNSTVSPREKIRDYKTIEIINNTGENICLIINFHYTTDEIKNCNRHGDIINKGYNRTDTFFLKREFPENHSYEIILPIKANKRAFFPSSFEIEIYDYEYSNILKKIDYKTFLEILQKKCFPDNTEPLDLNNWTIVLDSTLFDINYFYNEE